MTVSVNQSSFVKRYPGQHKRTHGRECSRCDNDRQVGRYCRPCHAAYMRDWRKTHPLTPEQRRKDNARSYAGVYLRRGKLIPQPCKRCKAEKAEMHHPDYSQPLNVIWLCRPCHLYLHKVVSKWRLPMIKVYKHKKTGGYYTLVSRNAKIEATLEPVCVYRSLKDNTIWVRPESEFFDGRFEHDAEMSEVLSHENEAA